MPLNLAHGLLMNAVFDFNLIIPKMLLEPASTPAYANSIVSIQCGCPKSILPRLLAQDAHSVLCTHDTHAYYAVGMHAHIDIDPK